MVTVLLIIHIMICIAVYFLMRLSVLKAERIYLPLVYMVPVWGVMGLIILELRCRGSQEINEKIGIEKLKINDEIHRSILMDEDSAEQRVVPLEEALLLNDTLTRRELMMDIMYSNPEDYVSQLKKARMNDDTEVVHYAVTALAELQKEYELRFQELDRRTANDPDDDSISDEYLKLLRQYLNSGIAEGEDLDIRMRSYSERLGKKIQKTPERLSARKEKAEVDLRIGEYEAAYEEITHLINKWSRNEAGYLLMLQYYSIMKKREGIDRVLDKIRMNDVYLTPRGRKQVQFWMNIEEQDVN